MPFSYEPLLMIFVVVRSTPGSAVQSSCVHVNRKSIFGPGVRIPGMPSSSSSFSDSPIFFASGSFAATESATRANALRSALSTSDEDDDDDDEEHQRLSRLTRWRPRWLDKTARTDGRKNMRCISTWIHVSLLGTAPANISSTCAAD